MSSVPAEYIQALKANPDLCIDGMRLPDKDPKSPFSEARFSTRQKMLLEPDSIKTVNLCRQHIDENGIQPTCSSYGLKHKIERIFNHYVTNGQFMLAAVMCGYELVRIQKTQNCTFRLRNGKKPRGGRHE